MIETVRLGYFIASIVYLTLFVIILLNRRRAGLPRTLHLATVTLGIATCYYGYLLLSDRAQLIRFLMLYLVYASVLMALLIKKTEPSLSLRQLVTKPTNALLLLATLSVALIEFFWQQLPLLSSSRLYLIHLTQMIIGILAAERYWRTQYLSRFEAKPLMLYALVFYVSGGLLFASAILSGTFYSLFVDVLGWVLVLSAPLIALDIRRESGAKERSLYLSREVVYSGSMLVFLGGFLLMVSLGYTYIDTFLDTDYLYFEVWLLAAVGAGAAIFLFKSRLRQELKVFIGKHFYTNKYDYRSEWLKFTQQLTDGRQDIYRSSLQSLMTPFDAKYGALYLVHGDHLVLKAHLGQEPKVTLPVELVSKLVEQKWILDFEHITEQELVRFDVTQTQAVALNPYTLLVPFSCKETQGVFLMSHPQAAFDLDYEDRDFLNVLASHISVNLHLEHTHSMLNESKQFESFHRMSAFVLHDLKNVSAQLDMIIQNAQAHRDNPAFIDDTFETIDAASKRLHKTVSQLTNKQQASTGQVEHFSLVPQIESALNQCQTHNAELSFDYRGGELGQCLGDKERFTHVISHLVTNALQASRESDETHRVQVEFINGETSYSIKISDNGVGMSQEFIDDKLFQPFFTTKGNSGMGIGAYEAKSFIESLKGSIRVDSELGKGTVFELLLPKAV